jgi:hypothetical protein
MGFGLWVLMSLSPVTVFVGLQNPQEAEVATE